MASYIYVPQPNPPASYPSYFDSLQSMAAGVAPMISQPQLAHQQNAVTIAHNAAAAAAAGLQPIHQLLLSSGAAQPTAR